MKRWQKVLCEGVVAGSLASMVSTAALACFGKHRHGSTYGPTNAISHWFWGRRAFREDDPSLRHTATGYGIHHMASILWASLYSCAYGHRDEAKQPVNAIIGGAAAAAVSCFVDYKMTPKRLTPGFEERLEKPELGGVYAAFGIGLALAYIGMGCLSEKRK